MEIIKTIGNTNLVEHKATCTVVCMLSNLVSPTISNIPTYNHSLCDQFQIMNISSHCVEKTILCLW